MIEENLLEEFNELVKDISVEVLDTNISKKIFDAQKQLEMDIVRLSSKVELQSKHIKIISGVSLGLLIIIIGILFYQFIYIK